MKEFNLNDSRLSQVEALVGKEEAVALGGHTAEIKGLRERIKELEAGQEAKNKQVHLLTKPSTLKKLKEKAQELDTSVNALINEAIETYLK